MSEVLERLKHDFRLNASDEAILEYVIGHLKQVQRMSSHQLAKETYSSPTAVIRFVRKIGFENYNDFKLNIESFIGGYSLGNLHIASDDSLFSVRSKLREIERGIIDQTDRQLDDTVFGKVTKEIAKGRYVDILATDANYAMAEYFSHLLFGAQKIANVYNDRDKQLWVALNVEIDHAVIIISKHGEDSHLVKVAGILKKRGIPFIVVTATKENSLGSLTPLVLFGVIHDSFESLKEVVFYISLKYIFDLIYAVLISGDMERAGQLSDLHCRLFDSRDGDVTL